MFGFTICLMVLIAPLFFAKATETRTDSIRLKALSHFSLDYAYKNTDNSKYVKLKIVTVEEDSFNIIYNTADNKHKKILTLLQVRNLAKKSAITDILPIKLNQHELKELNGVSYEMKNKKIDFLAIDDTYIIGKEPTKGQKGFQYFLALLFFVIGLLGFLTTCFLLISAYKTSRRTGKCPDLPNMFEEGMKGWKNIFGENVNHHKKQ